jgi:hypothetical protein
MNRKPLLRTAALVAALLSGGASAAEMTIFQGRDFRGPSYTLHNNANLGDIDFQNRVSSIVVRSGTWDVCTEPNLQGECVTLLPGEYPRLNARLNDRIESMRLVDRHALEQRRGVVIYTQPNFTGKSLALRGDATNLLTQGMQDQASSIKVEAGRWEFCSQPDFNGDCVTLARGDYPTLEQKLNHRIESVREVERVADRGDRRDQREYARREGGYDYRERNDDSRYRERDNSNRR